MAENVWAWRNANPYLSTPFQIVDVDPLVDRSEIRTRATVRRRRISHAADRFPLFGRTLTVAEVNEAEEQLDTPRGRLLAELLTHRPESSEPDLADLLELLDLAGFFEMGDTREEGAPQPRSATDTQDLLDPRVLLAIIPDPGAKEFAPLWADDPTEPGERTRR